MSSWAWDFDGDGVTDSAEQNPSHTYDEPGVYTVVLTVSGPGGDDTSTKADLIHVSAPGATECAAFTTTGEIVKSGWNRNCGWRFTCKADITVTKIMLYGDIVSTVTIWDDEGGLLATVENVHGGDGCWKETPLATPLQLRAGATYRITVYTETNFWYVRSGGYQACADIEIINGCYGSWDSEGFPHILQRWAIFGLVNFKYTK